MAAASWRATVLVVDDDAAIRGFVRQVLEGEGHRVVEAADGAAALAAVEEGEVDLVLLDLSMPVMDGAQFAAAYRGLDGRSLPDGHAPIVVFTAQRGVAAAEHAERLRAVGFLTKPFDIDDLVAVVARCARGRWGSGSSGAPDGTSAVKTEGQRTAGTTGTTGAALHSTPASPTSKRAREELEQQQRVRRLRTHLDRLQRDMGEVRLGVAKVAQIEASRRLTRDEARWASQLRLESERLRLELQGLREEFFRLKDGREGG